MQEEITNTLSIINGVLEDLPALTSGAFQIMVNGYRIEGIIALVLWGIVALIALVAGVKLMRANGLARGDLKGILQEELDKMKADGLLGGYDLYPRVYLSHEVGERLSRRYVGAGLIALGLIILVFQYGNVVSIVAPEYKLIKDVILQSM